MEDPKRDRDIVVVNGERNSSVGWIIGLIVLAILIILFFYFGGFELFTGANTGTETINVETPETIQVQPAN